MSRISQLEAKADQLLQNHGISSHVHIEQRIQLCRILLQENEDAQKHLFLLEEHYAPILNSFLETESVSSKIESIPKETSARKAIKTFLKNEEQGDIFILGKDNLETESRFLIEFVDLWSIWCEEQGSEEQLIESTLWRAAAHIRFLGTENLDTLHALMQLGITYRTEQELTLAKDLLLNVHANLCTLMGDDSLPALQAALQICILYNMMGMPEEASEIAQMLVNIWEEELGSDAPETLMAICCFAESLFLIDEYEEALSFFQDALPFLEEQFGDVHEQTLKSVQIMALCFAHLEDSESASYLMEERYQRTISSFGHGSIEAIESLEEWIDVLITAEWHEKASEHLELSLSLRKQFPEYKSTEENNEENKEDKELKRNVFLLPSLLLKGRLLIEEGYFEEATDVLKDVVILEDLFSTPDLPSTDAEQARKLYADALGSSGQYTAAIESYQQALPILQEAFGNQHKSVVEIELALDELTSLPHLKLEKNINNLKNNNG
ncbi:MAG: hypothetical protein CMK59_05105 [Proteobacteria bacterium]|nr:hypothetical protein [Pseudomonadota bacterium]